MTIEAVADDAAASQGDFRDDRAPRRHYHPVGIAFHWTIAALILFQLLWGWRMGQLDAGYDKLGAYGVHAAVGVLIVALAGMRAAWRVFESAALPGLEEPEDFPAWQKLAAKAVHGALYGVMFALPLTGWLMLSADGRRETIALPGGLDLPRASFIADLGWLERARWEDTMELAHLGLVFALLALLALHIGAALKHHVVNRDGVLARMIPLLGRNEASD